MDVIYCERLGPFGAVKYYLVLTDSVRVTTPVLKDYNRRFQYRQQAHVILIEEGGTTVRIVAYFPHRVFHEVALLWRGRRYNKGVDIPLLFPQGPVPACCRDLEPGIVDDSGVVIYTHDETTVLRREGSSAIEITVGVVEGLTHTKSA